MNEEQIRAAALQAAATMAAGGLARENGLDLKGARKFALEVAKEFEEYIRAKPEPVTWKKVARG